MCLKGKFDKITREDVVDAICKLEKESDDISSQIFKSQTQIDELKQRGRKEVSHDLRLYYAKKINSIKAERQQNIRRDMFLMYNISLLNKLKRAIDDNQFFTKTSKLSLGNLLGDQKGLAKFLNKTLNTRVAAENVLTDADETFKQIEEMYDSNEAIYGVSTNDDELLAVFEEQDDIDVFEEKDHQLTSHASTEEE